MRTQSRFILPRKTIGWAILASVVGVILVPGCADNEQKSASPSGAMAKSVPQEYASAPMNFQATQASGGAEAKVVAVPIPKAATANRKIIYDAQVELVTEDLNKLETGLLRIIEAQGAYVADSDRTGTAGATRHGHWKVRVPVEAYDAFVRGVLGLGELVSTRANSQDVTAEYYDLDARQIAKKVEEARLLKHLADSTGRLEEILTVERELSRVRSEIEQMQGRLAVLSNLTALATVTVTASEIKDYVPPQAPTLSQRVARTFAGSVESIQTLGEAVLLALVAFIPWIPLAIPAAFLLVFAVRRGIAYLIATNAITAPPRAG